MHFHLLVHLLHDYHLMQTLMSVKNTMLVIIFVLIRRDLITAVVM